MDSQVRAYFEENTTVGKCYVNEGTGTEFMEGTKAVQDQSVLFTISYSPPRDNYVMTCLINGKALILFAGDKEISINSLKKIFTPKLTIAMLIRGAM